MTNKRGAIALSVLAVALIAVLYFGNFTTKKVDKNDHPAPTEHLEGMSFEEFEKKQIPSLTEEDKSVADKLIKSWSESKNDSEKIKNAHELAHFWESKSPELAAYYHVEAALLEKNVDELVSAGDQMILQFRQSKNDEIRNNLITFALRSFEAALKLSPNDNSLKLKTGAAYVEGSVDPMKGISLLREVISEEPDNVPALILLGRFSIMSGQFDKAKERLDQALLIEPSNAEAIFFMAITQQGLGNNDKAIELFEACKKLVNNPDFDAEINGYIQDLKSNKK